jgi:hypothetical protein
MANVLCNTMSTQIRLHISTDLSIHEYLVQVIYCPIPFLTQRFSNNVGINFRGGALIPSRVPSLKDLSSPAPAPKIKQGRKRRAAVSPLP